MIVLVFIKYYQNKKIIESVRTISDKNSGEGISGFGEGVIFASVAIRNIHYLVFIIH